MEELLKTYDNPVKISDWFSDAYTYSSENQLIRIDYPDGTCSAYRYDALGRRIKKDVNGLQKRGES